MVDGRYSECHAFIVIKRIDRQTVRHEFMPYLQHTMFSTPVNERKKTKQKRTHNTHTHTSSMEEKSIDCEHRQTKKITRVKVCLLKWNYILSDMPTWPENIWVLL